jgi:hypothetical protein
MWKCLIDTKELITYEKLKGNLKVRIEARYSDNLWEIYKTYHSLSSSLSFVEEYEAQDRKNALTIISKIKQEVLDEGKIKKIQSLKENIQLKLKRQFKEQNVEKWSFSLGDSDYINFIYIRYANPIEIDIMADEKYKYLENEIIDEINKVLGFDEITHDMIHNVLFFSKKSSYFTCDDSKKDIIGEIKLGIDFSEDDLDSE